MMLNLMAAYFALQTVPFIALIPALPYTLRGYMRTKSVNVWRCTYFYSFVLYYLCAYFMTILPVPSQETLQTPSRIIDHLQLIPFANFADIKRETFVRDVAVLLFNVVLTLPFGFYLRALYKFDLRKTLLAGFGIALFFEVSQLTGRMNDGLRGTPCEVRLDKHFMKKLLILSIPVVKHDFSLEAAIEESRVEELGDQSVQMESYSAAEKKVCIIRIP